MSTQDKNMNNKDIKVLPAGAPFLAAGVTWFILAMILPVHKLSMVILITVLAAAAFALMTSRRNKQLSLLPPPPTVKVRAEEMARRLDLGRDSLLERVSAISSPEVRASVSGIAATLEKIADCVEQDPKDRNKARKLANHYVDMLIQLTDKYLLLQAQHADGANISASMAKIQEGLAGADTALRHMLDDMFTDDAMEVSADIAVLENLLKTESTEATMDFSSLT